MNKIKGRKFNHIDLPVSFASCFEEKRIFLQFQGDLICYEKQAVLDLLQLNLVSLFSQN